MMPSEIEKTRDGLGLTQEQFAKRVGVRQATVSDWERGRSRPSRMAQIILDRLAWAARVTKAYDRRIEFHRTNQNDPHGIGNAVICSLEESKSALLESLA